jgi:hypothetical protein
MTEQPWNRFFLELGIKDFLERLMLASFEGFKGLKHGFTGYF